jgi:putative transposase
VKFAYKYRLFPTKTHIEKLETILEHCRELYNSALEHRIGAYKRAKVFITYKDQANSLPEIKEARPEFEEIYSQVLQDILRRLDKNFKAFFRRGKGYPRFKGKQWFKSFCYPQSGWSLIGSNKIQVSKIGIIKIKQHRPFPKIAVLKTLTLKREITKWYAIVSLEIPDRTEKKTVKNVVGIDLGIKSFAVLSDGTTIENPKHLSQSESKLANAQKILSRKKKGTKAREKAKVRVAKIHRKIANQRTDFLHKTSRQLVDCYDLIAYEDLKIKKMMQYGNLAKSIGDCSWGRLAAMIAHKSAESAKYAIAVDPRGTSQLCSNCGSTVPKKLSDRIHNCHSSHIVLDRDLNSSINILRLGTSLQEFAPEMPRASSTGQFTS